MTNRECVGWPDQPCTWAKCLDADACQNPHGPQGGDIAITPGGEALVEVEGATILSAEWVTE